MHEVCLLLKEYPCIRYVGNRVTQDKEIRHPDRVLKMLHVFLYVASGEIHVIEDAQEYRITAGSFLFLKSKIAHWGGNVYPNGTSWYYIHFYDQNIPPESTVEYPLYPPSKIIPIELYDSVMTLPKFGKVSSADYIENILKGMISIWETPSPQRPFQLCSMTMKLFYELYYQQSEVVRESAVHRNVSQIMKLIQDTSPQRVTSQQISEFVGMNYSYLSNLFKKHTGKSITQYQNELLINKAVDMLTKETKNITEVSEALGFPNPFYFSRVFKKELGLSPSAFLKHI